MKSGRSPIKFCFSRKTRGVASPRAQEKKPPEDPFIASASFGRCPLPARPAGTRRLSNVLLTGCRFMRATWAGEWRNSINSPCRRDKNSGMAFHPTPPRSDPHHHHHPPRLAFSLFLLTQRGRSESSCLPLSLLVEVWATEGRGANSGVDNN